MSACRVRTVRALGASVAIAVWAIGAVVGCSNSTPATAPAISAAAETAAHEMAASELAVSELLPAFESPEVTAVPPTLAPPAVAPSSVPITTVSEADAVVGDPRGSEVIALIAFPWRATLPGWSIAFLPARVGLRGLTRVDDRRIEIYVRDADTAASLARVVAHELGHAVDVELNSPDDRERWRVARGVSASASWWPGNAISDFDTLAGDFAEAFATMLTGSLSLSRIAPPPGPAEFELLAELAVR